MDKIISALANELGQNEVYVANVVELLDSGNTIPFIARYRKEMHGAMDDTLLRTLQQRLNQLRTLQDRRETILATIEEQGKLTDALRQQIDAAQTMTELEDLYLPFKPKRMTRATVAKEKGLEPLADLLYAQNPDCPDPALAAEAYINPEKGVESVKDALAGASDIIAERVSDNAAVRKQLRELIEKKGNLHSQANTEEDTVYRQYYNFTQRVAKMQGYQVLAINRGEKNKALKVSLELDRDLAIAIVQHEILSKSKKPCASTQLVSDAIDDAYDRLLFPALERATRSDLTEMANTGAIEQFAHNLKPLLMQSPVKGKVTMGLDPGYRMGCKVAVVDDTGKVLDTTVVYLTTGEKQRQRGIDELSRLVRLHRVEHIAIGNGTASRETEQAAVELIHRENAAGRHLSYMIVSEAGASVYSASPLGAEEFPQFDANLRSAISIARRLQDPLAELVKIEPRAIGVGQYQHDMPSKQLNEALDAVVEDCVNAVGVDLNTASPSLLRRVSGLTSSTARNIVAYREEHGAFTSRSELRKVPKLGPKSFQQCAGFLRIPESDNVFDNTAVHPESYAAAEQLLALSGHTPDDVRSGSLATLADWLKATGKESVAAQLGIGVPTLQDVVSELMKPGRDIRDDLPHPVFRTDVMSIEDLEPGMILSGTVRNVIDFGAFVDVGVHQDGLVHISEIANRHIRHPSDVLSVGDNVNVFVLDVDIPKRRISLSIKRAN